MTINDEQPRAALFLQLREMDYLTPDTRAEITASVVWLGPNDEPRGDNYQRGLDGLRVSAYTGPREAGRSWGWSAEFRDVYCVDLRRAEAMAKTLKLIDRRLLAANERDGYPADFHAYLARIANALKITRYVAEGSAQWQDNTGRRWRVMDARDAQRWIADTEARYAPVSSGKD